MSEAVARGDHCCCGSCRAGQCGPGCTCERGCTCKTCGCDHNARR